MRFVYLIALRSFFLSFSFVVRQFVSLCGPLSQSALSGHDSSNFHFVIDEIISTSLVAAIQSLVNEFVYITRANEKEKMAGDIYTCISKRECSNRLTERRVRLEDYFAP